MEDAIAPAIHIMSDKPPAEPPPSLESNATIEELQWIKDFTTTAESMIDIIDTHHATNLCKESYTPHIRKLTTNQNINNLHLRNRIDKYSARSTKPSSYPLPPPPPYPVHIPTPKSTITDHSALLHSTDNTSYTSHIPGNDHLEAHNVEIPLPSENHTNSNSPDSAFEAMTEEQWEATLHKSKSVINITRDATQQPANGNKTFKICTESVQNNTGANRNVTSIKSCIHAYEDVEPFPIGGVKADDVAIICTGKGLLPWLSKEGKLTMVEMLYCTDVEGTIISLTTVVQQHTHLYQGFTIIANVDDGTGIL